MGKHENFIAYIEHWRSGAQGSQSAHDLMPPIIL